MSRSLEHVLIDRNNTLNQRAAPLPHTFEVELQIITRDVERCGAEFRLNRMESRWGHGVMSP